MKKKSNTTTIEVSDLKISAMVVMVAVSVLYVLALTLEVLSDGQRYSCSKVPKYRLDYVFPARQISCFLYTEVED
jgi:hypothetical protein